MELLQLKAYASGYRGCIIDKESYLFFQCSRNGRMKVLKSYPRQEFTDLQHFIMMMQKFISPPSFLSPPIPIADLTIEELERAHDAMTR